MRRSFDAQGIELENVRLQLGSVTAQLEQASADRQELAHLRIQLDVVMAQLEQATAERLELGNVRVQLDTVTTQLEQVAAERQSLLIEGEQLQATLADQRESLTATQAENAELGRVLRDLDRSLARTREEARQLAAALAEEGEALSLRSAELRERDEQLEVTRFEVRERDEQLRVARSELVERDELLARRSEQLEDLSTELRVRDEHLHVARSELVERDELLAGRSEQLEDLSTELRVRDEHLHVARSELVERDELLARRSEQLEDLSTELRVRDETLARQSELLGSLDAIGRARPRRWRSFTQFCSWLFPPTKEGLGYVKEYRRLRGSDEFDADYYLSRYPDVSHAGLNPLMHYVEHGRKEGRQPLGSPEELPSIIAARPSASSSQPLKQGAVVGGQSRSSVLGFSGRRSSTSATSRRICSCAAQICSTLTTTSRGTPMFRIAA